MILKKMWFFSHMKSISSKTWQILHEINDWKLNDFWQSYEGLSPENYVLVKNYVFGFIPSMKFLFNFCPQPLPPFWNTLNTLRGVEEIQLKRKICDKNLFFR